MKTIILLGFIILSNTISPENHKDYVERIDAGTLLTIAIICLITDSINFYKTLSK